MRAAYSTSACQKQKGASLLGSPIIPESVKPRNSTRLAPSAAAEA